MTALKAASITFDRIPEREELDAELAKGIESIASGKAYTADEVDAVLAKEFGI